MDWQCLREKILRKTFELKIEIKRTFKAVMVTEYSELFLSD